MQWIRIDRPQIRNRQNDADPTGSGSTLAFLYKEICMQSATKWINSGFPPFSFTEIERGSVSLKKNKSQGNVEVTVNNKEENS
jgi:hypothetical protein